MTRINDRLIQNFLDGVHTREPVSGLTHGFYRYPACFSPKFVRAAIEAFTLPGQLVLDPFMGGATTLVEASALGRTVIGLDINTLACFIAQAKTALLSDTDIRTVGKWTVSTINTLNMRRPAKRASSWINQGYQRNINTPVTWPIRKSIELALDRILLLKSKHQEIFVRALILRTAQWALDCRTEVPSARQFREQMEIFLGEMIEGCLAYRKTVAVSNRYRRNQTLPIILNRTAEGLENDPEMKTFGSPRLVLTSPPYPGVHVMYHRWQILGRRETPAPYWIANTLDRKNGLSYTFGDRHDPALKTYFDTALASFKSLARIANSETLFVQMVAFSDPSWQLQQYLDTMHSAGMTELRIPHLSNSEDGRLWRTVPNRRWYADQRTGGASREVVLFHRRS